ncbi:MAG: sigma-70 family RNA polymerase sigma factor [Firmicutes bacterium]|nr:sigma-70 family RNA polymerase sigma factor [Bacillota bacterium]
MSLEKTAQSFEQALHASWEKLRLQAHMLTGNWLEAEDLVQEALTKAYSSWPGFRGEASFVTWVQRIMANLHKDYCRRKARLRQVPLDEWVEIKSVEQSEDPLRRLELQDLRQSLERALAQLPQAYRNLIILKYIKRLSYAELAQALECSIEAVRCRLYRARLEMRKLLLEQV